MAEDHGVAIGEALAQPPEPPDARTGVVDHPDPRARVLDDALGRQLMAQDGLVDVAGDGKHRRSERLEGAQDLSRGDVASVQDQLGGAQLLETGLGDPPSAARHVGVGDDGDHTDGR